MTDREQAIKDLKDIIATAEGIKGLSDDAGITISLDKIESLRFALESIKVDRAYDLAYEKVDFIEIPEGATNGDMIKALFPEDRITELNDCILVIGSEYQYQHHYPKDWWNAPHIEMDETLSNPDAGRSL